MSPKTRVKIIPERDNPYTLATDINKFIEENNIEVIDIKYQQAYYGSAEPPILHSAMIIYKFG